MWGFPSVAPSSAPRTALPMRDDSMTMLARTLYGHAFNEPSASHYFVFRRAARSPEGKTATYRGRAAGNRWAPRRI